MPVDYQELLSAVGTVCEHRQITVTVKESLKGGAIAGGSAFAGGLLGGPIGLFFGSVFGGLTAAILAKNKFRSIAEVIMYDLTPTQKEELADTVVRALQGFDITDLTVFLPLLMGNQSAQMLAISAAVRFLESEIGMSVNRNGLTL